MTKRDLVIRIANDTDIIQERVFAVLQKTLDYITESVARGETVEFRDFGVFEIVVRKPRVGRNPKKPEDVVTIPERRSVKFKPGREMKKRVLAGSVDAPGS